MIGCLSTDPPFNHYKPPACPAQALWGVTGREPRARRVVPGHVSAGLGHRAARPCPGSAGTWRH